MLVQFNNTVKSDTNYHEVNLSAPKLNNSNLQVLSKNNNAYLTGWARLVKSPPNTHVILRLKKIPNSWPSSLRMIRVLWMVVSFSFDFYFLPRITSNLKNYTSPPLQLPWTQFPVIPYYTLGNYSPKLTYWTTTFDMDGLHHLITWTVMELDISHELFTCTLLVGRSVVADEKWEFRSENAGIACTILEEKN